MMKMVWLIFFHLMFPTLSGARPTQEAVQVSTTLPTAVSVTNLTDVSTTVLKAETWLKTNVLAHYPSLPITTILVGPPILCSQHHPNNNLSLLLPALKNIHHSLTRWGLRKHIKLTSSLSSCCLEQHRFERLVKPILEFLESTNSTYSINPSPKPSHFSHETLRRLSSVDPFGFSAPAKNPKPPQPQMAFPPVTMSFSDAPEISPDYYHHHHQASPPYLPPCEHYAPAPSVVNGHRLWCVAKPSVPEDGRRHCRRRWTTRAGLAGLIARRLCRAGIVTTLSLLWLMLLMLSIVIGRRTRGMVALAALVALLCSLTLTLVMNSAAILSPKASISVAEASHLLVQCLGLN